MAIDDPFQAFDSQYSATDESGPVKAALALVKHALPGASTVVELFETVYDHFSAEGRERRLSEMWGLIVREFKYAHSKIKDLEEAISKKLDSGDLRESIQLMMRFDANEFNDNKRERYLRLLGNALLSEVQIRDLACFIQTIEELGESDIAVLKALHRSTNMPGDWKEPGSIQTSLHPNTFISRRETIAHEVNKALGLAATIVTNQNFSHEEGYDACARLQGFGLAHEIQLNARAIPVGDYCFYVSKRGLLLLKLLGEDVPNWEYYFPESQKAFAQKKS